ncbi:MAG: pyridoxamine 5'-phosphate oxidase family protein [Nitratireductor sp.]|nr:pyridoxamine 5'-phosphate oxidase family protein [Nitratireductor sp.]
MPFAPLAAPVTTLEALEALYDEANPRSLTKVVRQLTPLYRRWIGASRFVILSTVGPEGTDASPRGDDGPVVRIADDGMLLLPDWRGNNRIDSLRNIVRDGRVSLMFMVPGSNNVVRVNGKAIVTADAAFCASFEKGGRQPRSVIVVAIGEVYFQCAKALMRSKLWQAGDESGAVPTAGQLIREQDGAFEAEPYDAGYGDYARERMW